MYAICAIYLAIAELLHIYICVYTHTYMSAVYFAVEKFLAFIAVASGQCSEGICSVIRIPFVYMEYAASLSRH